MFGMKKPYHHTFDRYMYRLEKCCNESRPIPPLNRDCTETHQRLRFQVGSFIKETAVKKLLVLGAMLVFCGTVSSQYVPPEFKGSGKTRTSSTPIVVPLGNPGSPSENPSSPEEMTVEQLLDAVEALRLQKIELEKKEQTMMKALKMKMDKLKERIGKLEPKEELLPPDGIPGVGSSGFPGGPMGLPKGGPMGLPMGPK